MDGWIILTGVWELVQAINLDMMDVYLNGYGIIIYIMFKGTTMDDDNTNIVYCVFEPSILLSFAG